jgi:hypothetical protein
LPLVRQPAFLGIEASLQLGRSPLQGLLLRMQPLRHVMQRLGLRLVLAHACGAQGDKVLLGCRMGRLLGVLAGLGALGGLHGAARIRTLCARTQSPGPCLPPRLRCCTCCAKRSTCL